MELTSFVRLSGQVLEVAGVAAMLIAVPVAAVISLLRIRGRESLRSIYASFRHVLGRGILLGLEFLVAADIIRTVSESPDLQGVFVLGLIVVIRTFLSFTLEVELDGRWPWQQRRSEHAR